MQDGYGHYRVMSSHKMGRYYNVSIFDFLLTKQIPRGAKCFCKVSLKFCPQIQMRTKKRSLHSSGFISVRNFGFFAAKWVLLAKEPRKPDIFRPLSVRFEKAPPPGLPKIDAYGQARSQDLKKGGAILKE